MLNSTEDAHIESMSTFETDELLHPPTPLLVILFVQHCAFRHFVDWLNVVVSVYRMLCSSLVPALYQGHCKHQVPENAANSADLG